MALPRTFVTSSGAIAIPGAECRSATKLRYLLYSTCNPEAGIQG